MFSTQARDKTYLFSEHDHHLQGLLLFLTVTVIDRASGQRDRMLWITALPQSYAAEEQQEVLIKEKETESGVDPTSTCQLYSCNLLRGKCFQEDPKAAWMKGRKKAWQWDHLVTQISWLSMSPLITWLARPIRGLCWKCISYTGQEAPPCTGVLTYNQVSWELLEVMFPIPQQVREREGVVVVVESTRKGARVSASSLKEQKGVWPIDRSPSWERGEAIEWALMTYLESFGVLEANSLPTILVL